MIEHTLNRLAEELRRACRDLLFHEKWLIAPNRRVGNQWLERVVRSGQPALNVRVETVKNLVMELARPVMEERGVELIDKWGGLVLLDRAFVQLAKGKLAYLKELAATPALLGTILSSIEDLRLSGLEIEQIRESHFEVDAKGSDILLLMSQYLELLKQNQRIDYAEAVQLALARMRESAPVRNDVRLLLPRDSGPRGLEKQLIDAFPPEQVRHLEVDEPSPILSSKATVETGIERLRGLLDPPEALRLRADLSGKVESRVDDTVEIFRAVGETNEVREVVRRCLDHRIRLDEVELLHTDTATYVPAIYEIFLTTHEGASSPGDKLPVTFAEGIACRYARPGRALAAWVTWIREEYPQAILVEMIREGLIDVPGEERESSSFARLANSLNLVGVGFGRDRYLKKVEEQIERFAATGEVAPGRDEDERDEEAEPRSVHAEQLSDLRRLFDVLKSVIEVTPSEGASPRDVVASARGFLETNARHNNELDNNARELMLKEMKKLEEWLSASDEPLSLDAWEWLASLPVEARVLGSGPRPGCLHVDSIRSGGHTGRPHTFLVGLDDGRYPGPAIQDPILLDIERRRLSQGRPEEVALATSSARLEAEREALARLLSRQRGKATFSFSCRDLGDDREMFPSPVLLDVFRLMTGKREAILSDLLNFLPPPASFAPERPESCRDETEWWLWRLCCTEAKPSREALLDRHFPHLARGLRAAEARAAAEFTIFDGRIEQPGDDLDPLAAGGPIMSSSRFETLGRCPLAYFFNYGLGVKPPETLEVVPGRWLSPFDYGKLLHEVLSEFVVEKIQQHVPIGGRADEERLEAILNRKVSSYRETCPPPSDDAFHRQLLELKRAAHIFVVEEEQLHREQNNWPVCCETSIGLPAQSPGTSLDTNEPVQVSLPGGSSFRARGRVDRIDRIGNETSSTFAVWDYKTSRRPYPQSDPFQQGRRVQQFVYMAIATERLRAALSPQAQVEQFGYFFPSAGASGDRVQWAREQLANGGAVIAGLCQIAHQGAFLPTNSKNDCTYCDYRSVCGDIETVVAASQKKLDGEENTLLQPFRELREKKKENTQRRAGSARDDTDGDNDA